MNASIVVDLSFGDGGKGRTVDYLCKNSTKSKIVIRFSGGQQCGHHVMNEFGSHTHSNFGSGTLRGIESYFTEHCTIYPLTIWNEYSLLKQKYNLNPFINIHPLSMITTPYDVAFNQVLEKKNNHGSCGLGVGSTMKRNIESGYKLYGIDFLNPIILHQKLDSIKSYYYSQLNNSQRYNFNYILKYNNYELSYYDSIKNIIDNGIVNIRNYDYLNNFEDLIFEGSQGILLDMNHGIFPNVTYANTTSKNALEVCKKLNISNIELFYVNRCYLTRHGNGWMPNHNKITLINTENEINVYNEWQKNFKTGEIDYDLLKYSLDIDNIYSNECINKNIVITCLDQRPDFKLDKSHFRRYKNIIEFSSPIN